MTEEGLNQNPVLRALMLALIDAGATAFVETGTLWGDTCIWIAKRRPTIPIYTCEINPHAIDIAWNKFTAYNEAFERIHAYSMSSEKFIPCITDMVGNFPLFYLDAHWGEYWPILDELRAIAQHWVSAYIVIHDFFVPDIPKFRYYFKGTDKLDIDYIRPILEKYAASRLYEIFYPSHYLPGKSGFAVLFQNITPVIDPNEFTQGDL